MDVMKAIETRRSIRKYFPTPVEQEKLTLLTEAARLSPSARNEQNWKFIVVRDPEKMKIMYEAAFEQPHMGEAPHAIVVCGTDRRTMNCGQPTETVNPSIAMAYMLLEAHELGLGMCWMGRFKADVVKEALGIPEEVSVVAISPLGYPAESPEDRGRNPADEVISYDKY